MGERSFVEVSGGRLEVDVSPGDDRLPVIVFLHEGLGSIDLWRTFPADVGVRAGGPTVVVYSRHGYGRSAPAVMPRPVEYMHHEADVVLPELLAALGVERPVLVGHSDGASIALLHAGAGHPAAALVCIAPHVFVEPESIAGVTMARRTFEAGGMARRMQLYHDDPVATFRGWHDAWASDEFRTWNIEDRLSGITAPVLVVQGLGDQYGTVEQVDRIEAGVRGRCDRLVIDGAGHAPHLDEPDLVGDAVARFVSAG
ncbi:alpha/beta fold hydrolase [Ilumatobacter sp.]|uniref:alpha/beta fold hydrolase n=1 Tax=Ilumatobacter sp. TaxID=1967498 RepID=UPI003AF9BB0F